MMTKSCRFRSLMISPVPPAAVLAASSQLLGRFGWRLTLTSLFRSIARRAFVARAAVSLFDY